MADVTGSITGSDGTKDVQLNNAATEATLKLLLQSNLAANKQSIDNIRQLAQKSGLDPASVAAANANIQKVSQSGSKLGTGFEALGFAAGYASKAFKEAADLTSKLASGGAQASDVFAAFSKMPLGIGLVSSGFQKLAAIQESYVKTYQELGSVGVSFGGSLTEMRKSASQSYLTLDQFSKTVKENSSVFSTMGGDLQQGVNQFVKIQNTLLAPGSDTSKNLAYLGINAQEAADLTASYMRSQGNMNKMGLRDANQTATAVAGYAQELSTLSALTGKSTAELRKKMDEENAEAQWSAALSAMSPEKAEKMRQGLQNAMAQGGKPAMEAFKAIALGLPPMTESARLYTATQQAGVAALQQYSDRANDAGVTTEQNAKLNRATLAKQIAEGAMDREKLQKILQADALAGGKLSASFADATKFQTQFMKDGKMLSEQEIIASMEKTAADKKKTDGDAVAAQQAQTALNKLGQELLDKLLPVFQILQPIMLNIIGGFTEFVKYLANSPILLGTLGGVIVATTAAFVAFKVASTAAAAAEKAKLLAAAFKEGGAKGVLAAMGPLGSKGNPMHVIVVGFDGGGGGGSEGKEKPGAAKKGLSIGKIAKIGGVAGAVMGLANLAGDLGDISEQQASGAMSAEEAKKAKSGAVGEAGGNMAGGFAGAAAGAAIGSVVPVVGTIIGGLIGGALGAWGGGSLGKMTGEFLGGSSNKAPTTSPTTAPPGQTPITRSPAEILQSEIQTLNKTMSEMLKYMKETAEYARRNVDATRSLSGNLFPAP